MGDYIAVRITQVLIVALFVMGMISLGIEIYSGRLPL